MTPERLEDFREFCGPKNASPDADKLRELLAHVDALTARAEAAEQDARDWAASSARVSELGRERLRAEAAEKRAELAERSDDSAYVSRVHLLMLRRAESAEALLEEARWLANWTLSLGTMELAANFRAMNLLAKLEKRERK